MRKRFWTGLVTGLSFGLLAATLTGCGNGDPGRRVPAGAANVLGKVVPARYSGVDVSSDSCLLFLKAPSTLEVAWNEFGWIAKSSNAREEDMTGQDSWRLRAHREGVHWVVDDYSVDPKTTSPADVASLIKNCVAAVERDDRAEAEEASEEASKAAQDSTAAWVAAASGTDSVVPPAREN